MSILINDNAIAATNRPPIARYSHGSALNSICLVLLISLHQSSRDFVVSCKAANHVLVRGTNHDKHQELANLVELTAKSDETCGLVSNARK